MTASETIDIVDDEDRVVGNATRREMRERNLLHRAVYIFVVNAAGELFVHRRTPTKDVYPGYWDVCVGGVVVAGENYDGAAEREMAEELGVVGAPVRVLGRLRFEDAGTRVLGAVYAAAHDGPFVLQAEEIMSGAFVSRPELERILREERCCPDGIAAWRAYGTLVRGG
jgi:isopentenyldiphosphate isomerase